MKKDEHLFFCKKLLTKEDKRWQDSLTFLTLKKDGCSRVLFYLHYSLEKSITV